MGAVEVKDRLLDRPNASGPEMSIATLKLPMGPAGGAFPLVADGRP